MHLDFMKPEIWNGLVIGTVLVGLALAALRIMDDLKVYRRQRDQQRKPSTSFLEHNAEDRKNGKDDAGNR